MKRSHAGWLVPVVVAALAAGGPADAGTPPKEPEAAAAETDRETRAARRLLSTLVAGLSGLAPPAITAWVADGAVDLAAWADAPTVAWGHASELTRPEPWESVPGLFAAFGHRLEVLGRRALTCVPRGPGLLLVLALVAADVLLAFRWRALARLNDQLAREKR